jgi:hypothetical protein
MASSDKDIALQVIREWETGTGPAVTVAPALDMIQRLVNAYGDSFTLIGAFNALDSLSQNCDRIKRSLIRFRAENQAEQPKVD